MHWACPQSEWVFPLIWPLQHVIHMSLPFSLLLWVSPFSAWARSGFIVFHPMSLTSFCSSAFWVSPSVWKFKPHCLTCWHAFIPSLSSPLPLTRCLTTRETSVMVKQPCTHWNTHRGHIKYTQQTEYWKRFSAYSWRITTISLIMYDYEVLTLWLLYGNIKHKGPYRHHLIS